jgi:hypothetical protein
VEWSVQPINAFEAVKRQMNKSRLRLITVL